MASVEVQLSDHDLDGFIADMEATVRNAHPGEWVSASKNTYREVASVARELRDARAALREAETLITGTLYVGGMDGEQSRQLIDDAEAWLERRLLRTGLIVCSCGSLGPKHEDGCPIAGMSR